MAPQTHELPYPGLPREKPMLSYWLANTRASPLLGLRTTEQLPDHADLVIIGSGLSGVATAYFLLTAPGSPYANKAGSIVMLEAREACSGATGRNGGHCRPETYLDYPTYKKMWGTRDALHLIQMELDNLDIMGKIVKDGKVECDFWRGEGTGSGGMDVFMSESIKQAARDAWEEYVKDGGQLDESRWIHDPEKAQIASRVNGAVGAATYPAGQLYPFKLVQHLLLKCISLGLNFQCRTPVINVTSSSSSSATTSKWTVATQNRGTITATQVLHCANAWTSTILPDLKDHFMPVQGHCSAITPTPAFSGSNRLNFTQIIRWGKEQSKGKEGAQHEKFEYLIQRPSDGTIILGGADDGGESYYNTDDTETTPHHVESLTKYSEKIYKNWGKEAPGEGTSRVWTGVMGYTKDFLPVVGPVPGKTGQYILAGHNGHGMARIPYCAQGLAKLMLAGPDADYSVSGLPPPFAYTVKRIASTAK